MKKNLKYFFASGFLLVAVALSLSNLPPKANAQENTESFGVAYRVAVQTAEDQNIQDGMLISHNEGVYQLSSESYDRNVVGVVSFSPNIEFSGDQDPTKTPILDSGTALVLVSGENGPIQQGDLITTSNNPGVGMKSLKSGFTVGIATEDFNGSAADDFGLIGVLINKNFTFSSDTPDSETISDRLRDVVSLSAIAALDEPKEVLKYVVSGIILISAITIAFISFSRTSQKGIEALGRNPLARSSITTGIFVNILVSIIIIVAGVSGAYFVVTL